MASRRTLWGFLIAFFALIAELSLQRVVPSFYSSQLLQAPKGHYVELNFTLETSHPTPCIDDMYLAIRDGYNKSANLLGRFCGSNISGIVRSSGQNLWIRKLGFSKHYIRFWGSYTNKTLNITVYPSLDNVATTQFVFFNQTSSLWCPAQGAPAPIIVWRKNGTVVQNSTSVQYQLNTNGENDDKYSCEVNRHEKREIHLVIESCPNPCKCTTAVGMMSAATRIKCGGKHLQSVPRHLPLSTAKLDLDNNQIEELPPGVFNNNTELNYLWLRNNKIKKLRGDSFSQLVKLKRLDLGTNQIEVLPPDVFHNNTELVKLWLDGNKIKKFSGDLFSQLIKLQWLKLGDNQIEELPSGVFNYNTELIKLWLNKNNIKKLRGDVFTPLVKLQRLDLGTNEIEELPPEVFHNNTEVVKLGLNNNKIKKLSGDLFTTLVKTQFLKLDENHIEELPLRLFDTNKKLNLLHLDNNQIEELPPGVFNNNTELNFLWLNKNKIKKLRGDLFAHLVKLQWLKLDANQMEELPPGVFNSSTELTELWLNKNKIKKLRGDLFAHLVKLRWLDLGANQIEELPPGVFNSNTELTDLDLSNNKLEKLPEGIFSNLTKLTKLDLSNNKVEKLPDRIFSNLTRLTTLLLSSNQIEDLPPTIFANLTKLRTLKMQTNKLEKLHPVQFWGLAKLHNLYLSDNKLENLPRGIFKGLRELLIIEIFNNELQQVSIDTFEENQLLEIMYMHYNKFRELPYGFFEVQKDILRVSLDTNLMCCHMHKEDAYCTFIYNDDFADCESMFKNSAPRKSIWVIGIFSLVGAAFVITWRVIFKEKNVVQSIMLLHLAVSDGVMGIYLVTVGTKDLLWRGEYYLHDFQWRSGLPCQIIGAISLLSSEVSVMMLTLISADRLKNIVFPYQSASLKPKATHILCISIWAISFLLAFLPMFGIRYFEDPFRYHSYYGRSVVCLPLQLTSDKPAGWEYSVAIFVALNFAFFLFIMVAYVMILGKSCLSSRRLARQGTAREIQARRVNFRRETALARRVFFIILSDCVCWMPMIVIGMRSIIEKSFKAPGDLAVWIAVFALPINSALNPILYTLSTEQVRGILGNKLDKFWNYLKSVFFCCGRDQEGEGEGELANQQGMDENDQHGGQGEVEGEAIELAHMGAYLPRQGGLDEAERIEPAPIKSAQPNQGGLDEAERNETALIESGQPNQGELDKAEGIESAAMGSEQGEQELEHSVTLTRSKRNKNMKEGDRELRLSPVKKRKEQYKSSKHRKLRLATSVTIGEQDFETAL